MFKNQIFKPCLILFRHGLLCLLSLEFGPSPPGRALRSKSSLVPRCGLSPAIAKAGLRFSNNNLSENENDVVLGNI